MIVEKPWGFEDIWVETDRYVGKVLHIEAGKRLSLQYHEVKDEAIRVLEGKLKVFFGDISAPADDDLNERVLLPRDSLRIKPGVLHRFEAITDCEVLEVSTPELDDVVRVHDDYGRA